MVDNEPPDGKDIFLRTLINDVEAIDELDRAKWRRVDPELRQLIIARVYSPNRALIPENVLDGFWDKEKLGLRALALRLGACEQAVYQSLPSILRLSFSTHELIRQNGESKYVVAISRFEDSSHEKFRAIMPRLVVAANRHLKFFTKEVIPPYPSDL